MINEDLTKCYQVKQTMHVTMLSILIQTTLTYNKSHTLYGVGTVRVSGSVLRTPLRSALLTVLLIGSAKLKITKTIILQF